MGEPYTSYRIPASTRASARYGPFQPGGLLAGFSTRSRRLSGNFPTSPMYPYVPFLGSPTIAVCILASSSYVCPARFASIRDAANGASTAAMTATMIKEVKVSRRVKPRIAVIPCPASFYCWLRPVGLAFAAAHGWDLVRLYRRGFLE